VRSTNVPRRDFRNVEWGELEPRSRRILIPFDIPKDREIGGAIIVNADRRLELVEIPNIAPCPRHGFAPDWEKFPLPAETHVFGVWHTHCHNSRSRHEDKAFTAQNRGWGVPLSLVITPKRTWWL